MKVMCLDAESLEALKDVIKQNERIISMNETIITYLMNPPIISDKENEVVEMRPGMIE